MVRHTRWVTALVAVGLSVTAVGVAAQGPPPRLAKNVIFTEFSFFIIIGNVSVNYERRINDWLSGRVGVGAGYATIFETKFGGPPPSRHSCRHAWLPPSAATGRLRVPGGANWTYLYGIPFEVSFGHAF